MMGVNMAVLLHYYTHLKVQYSRRAGTSTAPFRPNYLRNASRRSGFCGRTLDRRTRGVRHGTWARAARRARARGTVGLRATAIREPAGAVRVGHEATEARVGARARPSRGARWLDVTSRARRNRDASGGVLRALANVAFCYTASVYVF